MPFRCPKGWGHATAQLMGVHTVKMLMFIGVAWGAYGKVLMPKGADVHHGLLMPNDPPPTGGASDPHRRASPIM